MRQTHHVPADVPQYFPFGYWSFLESTCEMSDVDSPVLVTEIWEQPKKTLLCFPAAESAQPRFFKPCGGTSNASVYNHGPWTILFVPLKGVGNWGAPGHVCSSHTHNLRRRLPINIVSGYAILQIRDMILCLYDVNHVQLYAAAE